jgi:dTDP-4-amino-4,6-dideoxygalactose transaminase
VYADIARASLNLDPERVKSALGDKTRAVLFQHTYGQSAGLAEVVEVAGERGLPVVEDCAQCMPSAAGSPSAARGNAAIFSNNLRKPLAAGSGGVAVTDNAELAATIRRHRDRLAPRGLLSAVVWKLESLAHAHLLRPETYWPLLGLTRALRPFYQGRSLTTEIRSQITDTELGISPRQAREGLNWLARIDEIVAHRRQACREYEAALEGVGGIELPCRNVAAALYYFPVLVDGKAKLLAAARRRRIELIAWPTSTPIYPVEDESLLTRYGYAVGSCPVAESVARSLVGLPTDPPTRSRHRRALFELIRDHHG